MFRFPEVYQVIMLLTELMDGLNRFSLWQGSDCIAVVCNGLHDDVHFVITYLQTPPFPGHLGPGVIYSPRES